MGDGKRNIEKEFSNEFPNTEEGFGRQLHGQLYLKYINHYIYRMKETFNRFLPVPDDLKPLEGEVYKEIDDLVRVAVRHTNQIGSKLETNAYHAKVMRLEDAEKIFTLKEDLNLGELPKTVIPYEKARDAVLKQPDHLVVIDCPCRTARGDKGCYPRDVCIILGEPWASWVLKHSKESHPRTITQEEALEIVRSQHELGNVQSAYFKDACGDRLYALCNCCSCCCTAVAAQNYLHSPMHANSGYIAEVDPDKCVSCGLCAKECNFLAFEMKDDKVVFHADKCMGCGVCENKCPVGAITIKRADPTVSEPLDLDELIPKYGIPSDK